MCESGAEHRWPQSSPHRKKADMTVTYAIYHVPYPHP